MNSIEYFLMGYRQRDDHDSAVQYFTQSLRYDSNFFFSYYERAACYEQQRNFDAAVADLSAAIRLYPAYALPHFRRGLVKKLAGNDLDAQSDFDRAEQLNPLHYLDSGLAVLENTDQAIRIFNGGIELLDLCVTIDQTWRALVGKEDRSHRVDTRAAYLYRHRAELRHRRGDFEGAQQDFQRFRILALK